MPNKRRPTTDAIRILERRYYSGRPDRLADLEKARLHARLAQEIYARRKAMGLSQAELARRAKTSVSAICRLEDADYDGHSLNAVMRVLTALNRRLEFKSVPLTRLSGRPA